MRYSEEYLRAKKVVVIEEIAKIISDNSECMGVDLGRLVNNQTFIDEIGAVLAENKTDDETVREIRKVYESYIRG